MYSPEDCFSEGYSKNKNVWKKQSMIPKLSETERAWES